MSAELNQANRERQQIEERVLEETIAQIRQEGLEKNKTLVLASRHWHLGVVGIVASRIVERYHRPTVLIAIDPEGTGKGSARASRLPSLRGSFTLIAFGRLGRKYAAGLTIREDRIASFREAFEAIAHDTLNPEDLLPYLKVDAEVEPEALTFGLLSELERLAPFGMANPEPTLAIRRAPAFYPKVVCQQHLKLKLKKQGAPVLDAIGFRMGTRLSEVAGAIDESPLHMDWVFTPEFHRWPAQPSGGELKIQLRLKDFKTCGSQIG